MGSPWTWSPHYYHLRSLPIFVEAKEDEGLHPKRHLHLLQDG